MASISSSAREKTAVEAFRQYLEPYFLKKDYGAGKPFAAHFLVFYGNFKGLQQWLSIPEKVAQRVEGLATPRRLNPLHLAVILGEREMVLLLLGTKMLDLNAKDTSLWTVLHFAALVNDAAILQLLVEHGATTARYPGVPSPGDITRMVYLQSTPENQVCYFINERGEAVRGNGNDFCQLTSAQTYADEEVHLSPANMVQTWLSSSEELQVEKPATELAYLRLRKSNPSENICLVRGEGVGLEAVTRRSFKKGGFICEYLGEGGFEKPTVESIDFFQAHSGDYAFEDVNASSRRSLASMINDGTPNCVPFPFYNLMGRPIRYVVVALEALPAGTILRCNYGSDHPVKFGVHREADVKRAIAIYKELSQRGLNLQLEGMIDKMVRLDGGTSLIDLIDETRVVQLIFYLAQTPSLMAILISTGVVLATDLEAIYESPRASGAFPAMQKEILQGFVQMLKRISGEEIAALSDANKGGLIKAAQTQDFNGILEVLKGIFPKARIGRIILRVSP